ncbi:uncharacterized protein LOC143293577 isoform X8 [Babylonia areolata]|uniref:uncharacterized protein LOC143293577 isoform X8 n=1 Tax=Babylonia areolata TaxID=304850 RepID=UPI003FD67CCD
MDEESSTKFMGSLTKFLQSLCNGYVEFEDGVELIGHIYLSVDAGKTGKKLNYFLNEKVCKNDNSVTFISNSFHAQPEGKAKGQSGKDGEGKKDDEVSETSESVPKSTNAGTVPLRTPMSSRSAPSPNQSRSGVQTGTKRPGSPLSAPTPPSQRRMQSSVKSSVGSPVSKTVPSSPSSSSQDNIPSPSPARKNRSEISQPPSNQSDNASIDNESDIVPSNIMTINPPPDFASFIGSLTSDNQTSRDQRSPPDMKPDTDVTFIKEEFVSEPSSCAQTGSSGQSGRSGDDLYPVMLHQNTSVFPSTSSAYPSATATSQHPGFPGASTSQSDPFNPQDGADPSVPDKPKHKKASFSPPVVKIEIDDSSESLDIDDEDLHVWPAIANLTSGCAELTPSGSCGLSSPSFHSSAFDAKNSVLRRGGEKRFQCLRCGATYAQSGSLGRHRRKCEGLFDLACKFCGQVFHRKDRFREHLLSKHDHVDPMLGPPGYTLSK